MLGLVWLILLFVMLVVLVSNSVVIFLYGVLLVLLRLVSLDWSPLLRLFAT